MKWGHRQAARRATRGNTQPVPVLSHASDVRQGRRGAGRALPASIALTDSTSLIQDKPHARRVWPVFTRTRPKARVCASRVPAAFIRRFPAREAASRLRALQVPTPRRRICLDPLTKRRSAHSATKGGTKTLLIKSRAYHAASTTAPETK